jgi:hypothetical protein
VTDPRPTVSPPGVAAARTLMDGLDATHDQMRYWLDELKTLVAHLDEQGWDTWSRDHARSLIDFFGGAARRHHREVDRQVLPLVSGSGDSRMEAHVDQLRQDHGWLDESWSELNAQLQPVAEGFGGYDIDTLRQVASVYDGLLREQLAREKDVVPAARASAAA